MKIENSLQNTSLIPIGIDFSKEEKLTKSQKNIIDLLNSSLKDKKSITRQDIWDCWLKSGENGERYHHWSTGNWATGNKEYFKKKLLSNESYKAYYPYMIWFKSNLGSCIIKGKILAVPIIEI